MRTKIAHLLSARRALVRITYQATVPPAWGREVFRSEDGRASIFEKDLKGQKKMTHVNARAVDRGEQRSIEGTTTSMKGKSLA